MGFQTNYDNAERTLLVDFSSKKDTLGRPLLRLLPFALVKINGVDYYETMHEPFHIHDQPINQLTSPFSHGTRIQPANEHNAVSYNGEETLFEKHFGV